MLRKLAGKTGQLPESYLISQDADYHVEEQIFARGGFADVRKGTLAKKVVAVKTIRIPQDMDVLKIRKVGDVGHTTASIRYSCTEPRSQDFCKGSVLWMHTSHPNVLELIAVNIDPLTGTFSMIAEFMTNGNIVEYIRVHEANRIRLVSHFLPSTHSVN